MGAEANPNVRIASLVATNYAATVHMNAKVRPMPKQHKYRFHLRYGGGRGREAVHTFQIPDISSIDLWRLKMTAQHSSSNPKDFPTSRVFIFPESSPCIASIINDGGCVDAVLLHTCLKSVHVSFRSPDPEENVKVALHLTFQTHAQLTLSRGSIPAIQAGNWVLFATCMNFDNCPATTLQVEAVRESNLWWKLAAGAGIVILGTLIALLSVNAIYVFAYSLLNWCHEHHDRPSHEKNLWPVVIGMCGSEHWQMLLWKLQGVRQPLPFFPTLLTLMLGVFLATTAQFVMTHYGLMTRTGNRDICFYNEMCYYPGKYLDLPWNHIFSNFAYVVAAFNIVLQAFFAETRCYFFSRRSIQALFNDMDLKRKGFLTRDDWRELFLKADLRENNNISRQEWVDTYTNATGFDFIDENNDGFLELWEWEAAFRRIDQDHRQSIKEDDMEKLVRDIDLRAFYAIGVAFLGEGVGSMCYHLCPSVETFQFDTCFMIPIANLFTLALVDWEEGSDSISAVKYFGYILTPIWLVNFIGTWYDIQVFPIGILYWIYAFRVIAWFASLVFGGSMNRLFPAPGACGHFAKTMLQLCLIIAISVSFLIPQLRGHIFSGTANLFLMLSVLVMIFVVGRQLYVKDIAYMSCSFREVGGRLIKNSYAAVLCGVAVMAVICFGQKVVIVEPNTTPAQSHDVNQECVFGIFDLHDVWHLLSALALSLFAMLLLDVRVNSWARRLGIRILFEDAIRSDSSDEGKDSSGGEEPCF
ncbi:SID1 transmembrane family member 1 [Durusdinium trenchii]|uniref:SID1 transmembrane family member 1 n=1 Tax=Durusdinium trenchii TaxID=1381693 RepID=A0ABP0HLQ8_9DINO